MPSVHYTKLVQYAKALDPFGRQALGVFASTIGNPNRFGIRLDERSIGETAQVFEINGASHYIAVNAEILGTKIAVAVEMSKRDWENRRKYFNGIGEDTANTSLNDLVGVGAQPFAYLPTINLGGDDIIKDEEIVHGLLQGYLKAANDAGVVIPGGETGIVRGIVFPEQMDLAGASMGIIMPKSRFCYSDRVELGDLLYGLRADGPHANGFTAIRRIADKLPHGYFTELSSGRNWGEAVLEPTPSYAGVVNAMLNEGVEIHYLQPITGHGIRKIARSKKDFVYKIDYFPEMPEVFKFIQKHANIGDKEMLATYNSGVGFVIYTPHGNEKEIISIAEGFGMEAFRMGQVEEGTRQINVKPLGIIFSTEDIAKG